MGRRRGDATVVGDLRQQGSLKLLFPRSDADAMTAVLLNTAGGVTGGDRFETRIEAEAGGHLVATTQAAERAYRAQAGETGRLRTRIEVAPGARVDWLPQETIVYDGAALDRHLRVNMAADAVLLLVEPVIFGRAAMGETVTDLRLRDRIDVRRDGLPVFADRTRLTGNARDLMRRGAVGAGAGAMASLVYAAPDAARFVAPAREIVQHRGGVSLVRDGVLFARVLAKDGFALRRTLLPLIASMSVTPLPRTWIL
ncbi:MAG: urease accessory protein UreD [Rhodobacteraceae bacterium]|nr:urease accessory protein UreD [Paracoccaceae bacterium]